ncbi:hypothetical protein D3C71_1883010 [compost metagenome]
MLGSSVAFSVLSAVGLVVAAGGSVGAALLLLPPPHALSIIVKDKHSTKANDFLRPEVFFIFCTSPLMVLEIASDSIIRYPGMYKQLVADHLLAKLFRI